LEKIGNALEMIEKINGYRYNLKGEKDKDIGVLAQDIIEILPEAVYTQNSYYKVDYIKLIPLIIEAIKELKEEL